MKITIIGPSGAGKSTLSRKISINFSIPRLELDRIWFSHDGHKYVNGTPEEKAVIQVKILEDVKDFIELHDSWVCDGTYSKIQPIIADMADQVVLIQRPLLSRIWSHLTRIVRKEGRHPEVSQIQDVFFIKTIIKRWRKKEDQTIREFADTYKSKLVVLKSFDEIDKYFNSVKLK